MLGSTIQLPTTGWSHSKFHSDLDADIYRGRALSYQFVNTIDGGPAYTWSSIALQPEFMDGQMPMPIVVADERAPGQLAIGKTVKQLIPKKIRHSPDRLHIEKLQTPQFSNSIPGSWEPSIPLLTALSHWSIWGRTSLLAYFRRTKNAFVDSTTPVSLWGHHLHYSTKAF